MDLLDALVLLFVVAAVVMAGAALVLVARGGAGDPFGGAKRAGLERRVAHLSQRLEALESSSGARARAATSMPARADGASAGAIDGGLSRIGLVRFDAFADAGGSQSFSLALLDPAADGVLLTSLHSRQVTRLYVKSIRSGQADVPLSGEERAALEEAGVRT